MKKFAELIAPDLVFYKSRSGKRSKYKFKNLEEVLTPAQIVFLDSKDYQLRPHPRRINVVEIFLNTDALTERDNTVIALLFDNVRFK